MSVHHITNPTEEMSRHNLSLCELQAILTRYRADDSSWPPGLVHLQRAIRRENRGALFAVSASEPSVPETDDSDKLKAAVLSVEIREEEDGSLLISCLAESVSEPTTT
jgi:hypothetical protein